MTVAVVVRRKVVVCGRVQGVSYRFACATEARRLGCAGFVVNRADGSVEVEIEGEQDAVDALVAWCAHGPTLARVDDVQVAETAPRGDVGFEIRRGR